MNEETECNIDILLKNVIVNMRGEYCVREVIVHIREEKFSQVKRNVEKRGIGNILSGLEFKSCELQNCSHHS